MNERTVIVYFTRDGHAFPGDVFDKCTVLDPVVSALRIPARVARPLP